MGETIKCSGRLVTIASEWHQDYFFCETNVEAKPKPTIDQDKEIPGIIPTSYKWAHLKTKNRHQKKQTASTQANKGSKRTSNRQTNKETNRVGVVEKRELFYAVVLVEWSLLEIPVGKECRPSTRLFFNLPQFSQVDDKDTRKKAPQEYQLKDTSTLNHHCRQSRRGIYLYSSWPAVSRTSRRATSSSITHCLRYESIPCQGRKRGRTKGDERKTPGEYIQTMGPKRKERGREINTKPCPLLLLSFNRASGIIDWSALVEACVCSYSFLLAWYPCVFLYTSFVAFFLFLPWFVTDIPSMVGSYSSTKCDWMNWIVNADFPTPIHQEKGDKQAR